MAAPELALEGEDMRTITYSEALTMLERARDSKPADFRYVQSGISTVSHYVPRPDIYSADDPRSTCGCLIGTAFKLHGLPVPESDDAIMFYKWEDIRFTQKAMWLLSEAQVAQDDGETWPQAVYYGVRTVSFLTWNRNEEREYIYE